MRSGNLILLLITAFSLTAHAQMTPVTDAPSSVDEGSEPRFDWSKHQGETEVDHPLAEKGLMRITKDKTYIYNVERTPQKSAISVKVGPYDPSNLENPEQSGEFGSTFGENYDSTSNPAILVDYEWQMWRSPIGKWGIKLGSGIFVAQGHGHFESPEYNQSGYVPREILTFVAFPNTLAGVYRMQFWDKQLLVPYGEAGFIGWTFAEIRDDNKGPKFGAAPASFFALGGAFNLTYFDSISSIRLDREYGINRIYLTGEYRRVIGLSNKFDFTSNLFNGGLLVEF